VNTTSTTPGITRYGAANTTKTDNFYCVAPTAASVVLVGDFNNWDGTSYPMQQQVDGCWFLQVQLTHGHHLYRFLVDGKPFLDPRATGIARNERNEQASLIAVS